jgi:hypothetical protein
LASIAIRIFLSIFLRGEKFMTSIIVYRKALALGAAALTAAACFQSPVLSADLVGGYYAPSKARHYREVRTTYVRREVRDCQLLRITDPDGSRVVEICFKPIF